METENIPLESMVDPAKNQLSANASMQLCDVAAQGLLAQSKYLFVENADHEMIGIVETKQIQDLLTTGTEDEKTRWSQLTLESVLKWRLVKPSNDLTAEHSDGSTALAQDDKQPFTLVKDVDGVTAITGRGEVFVNWGRVSKSLAETAIDSVTGLPNRRTFERRIEEELQRARRQGHSVAVVLFDVDHFKSVNDMYGHGVGDDVLKAIADTMLGLLRSYDLLARYGGDEFAAICFGCAKDEIDIPLKRIQENFKTNFSRYAVALPPISLTIGTAVAHDATLFESANDLVELADIALYRGKDASRDCTWKIEVETRKDLHAEPREVRSLDQGTPIPLPQNTVPPWGVTSTGVADGSLDDLSP